VCETKGRLRFCALGEVGFLEPYRDCIWCGRDLRHGRLGLRVSSGRGGGWAAKKGFCRVMLFPLLFFGLGSGRVMEGHRLALRLDVFFGA